MRDAFYIVPIKNTKVKKGYNLGGELRTKQSIVDGLWNMATLTTASRQEGFSAETTIIHLQQP
jgi:hypothetical protein